MKTFCTLCIFLLSTAHAAEVPALPEKSGSVVIQVTDDRVKSPRPLTIYLRYPGSQLSQVKSTTGLFLDLHNWGGVSFEGAPSPDVLARDYDVISIGVQYYQSGDKENPNDLPYDWGYLQAMDALRALHYVYAILKQSNHAFDATRIYGAGGSGGGNVIQMCNKFAPHTFAAIVDLSGMGILTDELAYNLSGHSKLKGRFTRDPASRNYLSKDMQEIRDLSNPVHLALLKRMDNRCKVIILHGVDDPYCPQADKQRVSDAMKAAGLDVEPHYFRKQDVDGKLIQDSGHRIGDRTALVQHFAGEYFSPASKEMLRLQTPCDFERKETVEYPTTGGKHAILFVEGAPTLKFEKGHP